MTSCLVEIPRNAATIKYRFLFNRVSAADIYTNMRLCICIGGSAHRVQHAQGSHVTFLFLDTANFTTVWCTHTKDDIYVRNGGASNTSLRGTQHAANTNTDTHAWCVGGCVCAAGRGSEALRGGEVCVCAYVRACIFYSVCMCVCVALRQPHTHTQTQKHRHGRRTHTHARTPAEMHDTSFHMVRCINVSRCTCVRLYL